MGCNVGSQRARSAASICCRPNSWKPGESSTAASCAPSSQYHDVVVVVWRPAFSAREMSPTCAAASGTIMLISVLLPTPLAPNSKVTCPASSGASSVRAAAASCLNEASSTGTPMRRYGRSRSRVVRRGQIGLVEQHLGVDAGVRGGDQRAREQRLGHRRRCRDDHQQAIDVGGERFAAPAVLPPQQRAPWRHRFDHAAVAGDSPLHAIADHAVDLLAAAVAQTRCRSAVSTMKCRPWAPTTRPVFNSTPGFNQHRACRASILAAQMNVACRATAESLRRPSCRLTDSAARRSPAGGCE